MASVSSPANPAVNGASISFRQPETEGAPIAQSSYFRLGAYSDDELNSRSETAVVPLLTTVTSHPSSNHGVLLYTNHDLQENVLGAGWMRYAQGHVVEVVKDNASYRVTQGRYKLSARKGVIISAGEKDSEGKILTSSDIVITANGTVSQVVSGEVSRTTEGKKFETTVLTTAKLYGSGSIATHFLMNNSVTVGASNLLYAGTVQNIIGGLSLERRKGRHTVIKVGLSIELGLGSHSQICEDSLTITNSRDKTQRIVGTRTLNPMGGAITTVEGTASFESFHHKDSATGLIVRHSTDCTEIVELQYRVNASSRYIWNAPSLVEDAVDKTGIYANYGRFISENCLDHFKIRAEVGKMTDIPIEKNLGVQ